METPMDVVMFLRSDESYVRRLLEEAVKTLPHGEKLCKYGMMTVILVAWNVNSL